MNLQNSSKRILESKKLPLPLWFLLPFCRPTDNTRVLDRVATNSLFDRNVIALIAQLAQPPNPRFLRKWGSQGRASGQFWEPCGMAVHPTMDLVFVADTHNHRIQSFRSDGTAVKQWGSEGKADGQFDHPHGVAVLARSQDRGHLTRNYVFITDAFNDRIQVFDVHGSFIRKWGSLGRGDGEFFNPTGIAIHPTQDLIYVADQLHNFIQVFDLDGLFLTKWNHGGSANGRFDPRGIAVHPTRDIIFVSEFADQIHAFRSDGTFLFTWGSEGSSDGQFHFPASLALHPTRDLLFVSDLGNHRIQVFNLDGSFECKWGLQGEADGEFSSPWGLCVQPTKDVVYISDKHCVRSFFLFPKKRQCKKSLIITELAESL